MARSGPRALTSRGSGRVLALPGGCEASAPPLADRFRLVAPACADTVDLGRPVALEPVPCGIGRPVAHLGLENPARSNRRPRSARFPAGHATVQEPPTVSPPHQGVPHRACCDRPRRAPRRYAASSASRLTSSSASSWHVRMPKTSSSSLGTSCGRTVFFHGSRPGRSVVHVSASSVSCRSVRSR